MAAIGFGPVLALRRHGAAVLPPVFDFTGGVLPVGAMLTRASAATRVQADGRIASVAADVARFDHDPLSGVLLGLLIEPQRTNHRPHSAALDQWLTQGTSVVSQPGALAPDGGAAWRIADAGDGASGPVVLDQNVGVAAGPTPVSLFLKAETIGRVRLTVRNFTGVTGAVTGDFDLATGQPISGGAGVEMVAAAGGWHRATIVPAIASDDLGGALRVQLLAADGSEAMTRNGTNRVLAWGGSAESGAAATSYIATTAAAATRAADVLTLDWRARGVADGAMNAVVTFDDLSTQIVAMTVAGGSAALPAGLARARLRRVERI